MNPLEFVHLRSFVCVAEELHFGRAARRLGMTQPPLSRQIQLLEAGLGVALFDRSRHAVALTVAGQALLPEARALLAGTERAVQVARRAMHGRTGGVVRIGFFGATTYAFLPQMIAQARTELPDTELVLREMSGLAQLEALRVGRLDIGLVRPSQEMVAFASCHVAREGLALALPRDHRLTMRPHITLRDLEGEAFIEYSDEGPYMRALISRLLSDANVRPHIVQSVAQAQAILSLVSAGIGLAMVPEATRSASFANVEIRPIVVPDGSTIELHAAWQITNANPALAPLCDLLKNFGQAQLHASG
jgi:DNA-binding transcriptional LysR family regulator